MQTTSKIEFERKRRLQLKALFLVSFLASYGVIFKYFDNYGLSSTSIIFALIPFAVYVVKPKTRSYRYVIPIVFTLLIFALTGIELLLILALGFTCFFIVESKIGKLNFSAPFILLLAMPRIGYLFDLFGFPIRLKLTVLAGIILNFAGLQNTVKGNLINVQGEIFTVDTACMGLYMVTIGLFSAFLILAHFEKKHERTANFWVILTLVLGTIGAVIIANLFRIILIISFQAYEGTIAHELIGLGVLVFIVMLPAYFLLRKNIKNIGKSAPMFPKNSPWLRPEIKMVLNTVLVGGLLLANIKMLHFSTTNSTQSVPQIQPMGYEVLELPNRILQLSSARSLVYIKHQDAYRVSNHDPLLCWKSSGYEIVYENLIQIDNQDVFFAEMNLDGKTYYGAWWYDNGTYKTVNQTDWRWRSMTKNEQFNIVNVTCRNTENLKIEAQKLLQLDLFTKSPQLAKN